jgi:hypothetical protein
MEKEQDRIIDLTKVLIGFEGKWIILSEDKKHVIKSGKSLLELAERVNDGLIMRVPETSATYSPTSLS